MQGRERQVLKKYSYLHDLISNPVTHLRSYTNYAIVAILPELLGLLR